MDRRRQVLSTDLSIHWSGIPEIVRTSAIIDTGCSVDVVAGPELSLDLQKTSRRLRFETMDWGSPMNCEVYAAAILLDDWYSVEVFAPVNEELETIIGLPAISRSNLCIRGDSGAAYWTQAADPSSPLRWAARDAEEPHVAMVSRVAALAGGDRKTKGRVVLSKKIK